MPIIASVNNNGSYTPHPGGTYPAVCVDVYDRGLVQRDYGDGPVAKHEIQVYWYCGEDVEKNGETFPMLVSQIFNLVLGRNPRTGKASNLHEMLVSWRAKEFTEAELKGFDVEKLIGAHAQVTVVQVSKDGNTYANIKGVAKLMKGVKAPSIPEGFVRRHIRDAEREKAERQQAQPQPPQRHQAQPQWTEPDPVDTRGEDDLGDLPFS